MLAVVVDVVDGGVTDWQPVRPPGAKWKGPELIRRGHGIRHGRATRALPTDTRRVAQ